MTVESTIDPLMNLNLSKTLSPMVNKSSIRTNWDVLNDAVISDNVELVKDIVGDCKHYVDASWSQDFYNKPFYYVEDMPDGRLHRLVCQGDRPSQDFRGKHVNPILETAVMHRSIDTLRWLLRAGFGIEEKPMAADLQVMPMAYKSRDLAVRALDTALHMAIKGSVSGKIEAVQMLLQQGAKVNGSAFNAGIKSENLQLVQLLLRHGAHIYTTPGLRTAVSMFDHGNTDRRERILSCVSLLLEVGADVNNDQGIVLRTAVSRHEPRLVQLLLDYGADPNLAYQKKGAALRYAFRGQTKGDAQCVKLLLDAGANPNEHIRTGKPLRECALARKFPKFLGVTWDEMVAATEHVRQKR